MNTKEKAFEMIKKYADFTNSWEHDERIIHYATLAVDEILNLSFLSQIDRNYWKEVKQEIKNYEY